MDYTQLIETVDRYYTLISKADYSPLEKKSVVLINKKLLEADVNISVYFYLQDYILAKVYGYQDDILNYLNIKIPEERLKVIELLNLVNLQSLESLMKKSPPSALRLINSFFLKKGLKSQISSQSLPKLIDFVRRVKFSISTRDNILLAANYDLSGTIMPYTRNYLAMDLSKLSHELKTSETVRTGQLVNYSNAKKIIEDNINYLKRSGHTEVSLKDKDVNELNCLVIFENVALKAVIAARRENKVASIPKNILIDKIAIELVRLKRNQI